MTYLEPDLSTVVKAAIAITDDSGNEYVEENSFDKHIFIGEKDEVEIRISNDVRQPTSLNVFEEGLLVLDADIDDFGAVIDLYEYSVGDWETLILDHADEEGLS